MGGRRSKGKNKGKRRPTSIVGQPGGTEPRQHAAAVQQNGECTPQRSQPYGINDQRTNPANKAESDRERAERAERVAEIAKRRRGQRCCARLKDGAEIVAAFATVAVAVLTGVVVAYSGAQLATLIDQTKATRDAADAAVLQTTLANRPWLRVQISLTSPFQITADGGTAHIALTYKNSGNTPASYVTAYASIFLLDLLRPGEADDVDEVCRAAQGVEKASLRGDRSALTIFPNDEVKDELTTSISKAELDAWKERDKLVPNIDAGVPMLAVCVFYRFAYDLERSDHIAYQFFIIDGSANLVPAPWPIGGYESVGLPPTPRLGS